MLCILRSCKSSSPATGRGSRERNTVLIVPLEPACKAGLAGDFPVNPLQVDLKEVTLVVGLFIGKQDFFVGTKR